jgi:hypothetical protein
MAYVIEIDDLSKRIIYPPRGVEFEPVPTEAAVAKAVPAEEKPLWQQVELTLAFADRKPQPLTSQDRL